MELRALPSVAIPVREEARLAGTSERVLRFESMNERRNAKTKGVFRVLTQQLKTYFELLKTQFAPHAETALERAERLAREKRDSVR